MDHENQKPIDTIGELRKRASDWEAMAAQLDETTELATWCKECLREYAAIARRRADEIRDAPYQFIARRAEMALEWMQKADETVDLMKQKLDQADKDSTA